MQKFALRFGLFLLVTLAMAGVSFAQTPEPPTSEESTRDIFTYLAEYTPQDATFFAAVRTDPASFAAVDELIADLTEGIDGLQIPSLESLIASSGQSFTDLRAWLGDGFAVVAAPNNGIRYLAYDVAILVHVVDAAAARTFFSENMPDTEIIVQDDVMILKVSSTSDTPDARLQITSSLRESPAFAELLATLDAPQYAVLAYIDLPILLARNTVQTSSYPNPLPAGMLGRIFGPLLLGATRAENGDLLLDVAMTTPNLAGITPFGLRFEPEPVSQASLAYVPHDALMMVRGHDFPGFFVELWELFGKKILDAAMPYGMSGSFMNSRGVSDVLWFYILADMEADEIADSLLGNLLGINLDELLNWSSGDYVWFTRMNSAWKPGESSNTVMPVDFAGVFEIDDTAQSFAAFEKLVRTLYLLRDASQVWQNLRFNVVREADFSRLDVAVYIDDDSAEAIVISLVITNEIAVLGTGEAVDAALAQVDSGVAPWLADVSANFRANSVFNSAIQPSIMLPYMGSILNSLSGDTGIDGRAIIAKIKALTMDFTVAPAGSLIMRFGIGLNNPAEMETVLAVPTMQPVEPMVVTFPTLVAPLPTSAAPTLDPIIIGVTQTMAAVQTEQAIPAEMTPTFTPTPAPTQTALTFPTGPVLSEAFNLPAFRAEDGAFVLGNPDAPATLIIFSDWACPHCVNFHPRTLELIGQATADGAFNIEHRTLVTAGMNYTMDAAHLAECVDIQRPGSFWEVREYMYDPQTLGSVYMDKLALGDSLASMFDVDADMLFICAESAGQLNRDAQYAREIGANYTPFVAVRGADGTVTTITNMTVDAILTALAAAAETGEFNESPASPPDNSVQLTRAAGLANLAATRQAATPTP